MPVELHDRKVWTVKTPTGREQGWVSLEENGEIDFGRSLIQAFDSFSAREFATALLAAADLADEIGRDKLHGKRA
jgi:hypothetical protein